MRTVGPLPRYKITLPKGSAFQIETPEDQIKMHSMLIAIGKRGSGKTVAITSLLHNLKKDRAMDRLFVITPTWESNKRAFEGLPIAEEDVFHEPEDAAVLEVIKRVEQEKKDLEEYKEKVKLKRRMEKAMKEMKSDADIDTVDPELLLAAFHTGILDQEEPEHKWGGKAPVLGLFIDDSVGSKMLGSRTFLNFCLRHRHVGSGLGVSVFMASQAYTTQVGGLPKAIRGEILPLFKMTIVYLLLTHRSRIYRVCMNAYDHDRLGGKAFIYPFGEKLYHMKHEMVPLDRLVTGAGPDQFVVHKDGNELNCCRRNLKLYSRKAYREEFLSAPLQPPCPPPRQCHAPHSVPHQERERAEEDGGGDVGSCERGHIQGGVQGCHGGGRPQFPICGHGPQTPHQEIPQEFRQLFNPGYQGWSHSQQQCPCLQYWNTPHHWSCPSQAWTRS
jgi:hypothetical protein